MLKYPRFNKKNLTTLLGRTSLFVLSVLKKIFARSRNVPRRVEMYTEMFSTLKSMISASCYDRHKRAMDIILGPCDSYEERHAARAREHVGNYKKNPVDR